MSNVISVYSCQDECYKFLELYRSWRGRNSLLDWRVMPGDRPHLLATLPLLGRCNNVVVLTRSFLIRSMPLDPRGFYWAELCDEGEDRGLSKTTDLLTCLLDCEKHIRQLTEQQYKLVCELGQAGALQVLMHWVKQVAGRKLSLHADGSVFMEGGNDGRDDKDYPTVLEAAASVRTKS